MIKTLVYTFMLVIMYERSNANDLKTTIKEFLYTDSSLANFKSASTYLPSPFQMEENDEDEQYERLSSAYKVDDMVIRHSISKNTLDGNHKIHLKITNIESCELFIDLIKSSYDKDFVYYADGTGVYKTIIGVVNFPTHRIRIFCYTTLKSHTNYAFLSSANKYIIPDIIPRQLVECNFNNQEIHNSFIYQIDYTDKLIRDSYGYSIGEVIKFDDNIIAVEITRKEETVTIILNRKSGRLEANSDASNIRIYGICKAISSKNKF